MFQGNTPTFFNPSMNPQMLGGGVNFGSGGPTLQGGMSGGSSQGFLYQATATQPLSQPAAAFVTVTNIPPQGHPAMNETQVIGGVQFTLK